MNRRSGVQTDQPCDRPSLFWKDDLPEALHTLENWWRGKGLALYVTAPRDIPWENTPVCDEVDPEARWLDVDYRTRSEITKLSRTFFGGVAIPTYDTTIGPGSLGLLLGAQGRFSRRTVWFEPCIDDPDRHPPLSFKRDAVWWRRHIALIKEGLARSEGRFAVGFPDLIENLDTLGQLRGNQKTVLDLVERPGWVKARIEEINRIYFEVFDALWELLETPWGGNVFLWANNIWGPGKTAKVQCDFCCMISRAMFREFVVPALTQQCHCLDFSMYHLDGTQALHQLPELYEIEGLNAIEWTPQAGIPQGGAPEWYALYREIKAAGKSVQAVGVLMEEVEPLIDAVGPEGLFLVTRADSETQARSLLDRIGWHAS